MITAIYHPIVGKEKILNNRQSEQKKSPPLLPSIPRWWPWGRKQQYSQPKHSWTSMHESTASKSAIFRDDGIREQTLTALIFAEWSKELKTKRLKQPIRICPVLQNICVGIYGYCIRKMMRFIAVNDNVDSAVQTDFDMTWSEISEHLTQEIPPRNKIHPKWRAKAENIWPLSHLSLRKDKEDKQVVNWWRSRKNSTVYLQFSADGLDRLKLQSDYRRKYTDTYGVQLAEKRKAIAAKSVQMGTKTVAGILESGIYRHTENFKPPQRISAVKRVWNNKETENYSKILTLLL